MKAGAAIPLLALLACQPPPPVVRIGDLTVLLHLPPDQSPLQNLIALNVRVVDETGAAIEERHYAPDEQIDFEIQPVGKAVEIVLEGYADRDTMVARGSTGLVDADGPHRVGLYFGSRRSFGAVPSAEQPRLAEHAAIPLLDGQVLIAGGRRDGAPLAQVWRYDPVSAQFTLVGVLSTARTRIAAGRLADGRVLLAGGFDESGAPSDAIDVYDPEVDAITALNAAIAGVGGACAVALADGRVAIANGVTALGDSSDLLLFDGRLGPPATEVLAGPGRSQHVCGSLGDGLIAIGGRGAASITATHVASDGSSQSLALPYPIVDGAAFIDGSEVAVVCGSENQTAAVSVTEVDGTASISDRWRLALARTACTATPLRDGTLLVVGGHQAQSAVSQAEILHRDGSALTVEAPLEPRASHTATRLPGGEVLIVGGDDQPPRLFVP
ncbi:MAG: hypothetical protein JXR83_11135 [Deltaproteobacteria bacterium]|nr:hypothetical protein [Deltaproteobacteria bacterium]